MKSATQQISSSILYFTFLLFFIIFRLCSFRIFEWTLMVRAMMTYCCILYCTSDFYRSNVDSSLTRSCIFLWNSVRDLRPYQTLLCPSSYFHICVPCLCLVFFLGLFYEPLNKYDSSPRTVWF